MADKKQKMVHSALSDIQAENRKKLAVILNQTLADLSDLKSHAKQAHWNLRGPNFISYHKLADKIAEAAGSFADTTAERCIQLGGYVYGLTSHVVKASDLPAFPEDINDEDDCMEAVLASVSHVCASSRAMIEETQDLGDYATSDMYIDITRAFDKFAWMLNASIV
jgi:starvation-inducible DNA-binding protein